MHSRESHAHCLKDGMNLTQLACYRRDASELIFNVRAKLLSGFREAEARLTIGDESSVLGKQAIDAERATLLALSDLAQKQESAQVALNSVMKCQHLGQPIDFRTTLAIASVYWMKSQSFEAVQLLRDMLRDSAVTLKQVEKAQALSMIVSVPHCQLANETHSLTVCRLQKGHMGCHCSTGKCTYDTTKVLRASMAPSGKLRCIRGSSHRPQICSLRR
jgi:hypothetical protein